ncbi:MAG: c-type cytochrome [Acidobacteriaceae bacterium]
MIRPTRLFMLAGMTALLFLAGCHHRPKSKPLDQLTPTEMQGHEVFQSHCAVCHHPNSEEKLIGPGLLGLFQKPYLPSGAPATDERVRSTILHGKNVMPPFANVLDSQQIDDLLAYLHTV